MKFGNQWHAIDPADPVDSKERIPFEPTDKPLGECLKAYKVIKTFLTYRLLLYKVLNSARLYFFFQWRIQPTVKLWTVQRQIQKYFARSHAQSTNLSRTSQTGAN